MIIAGADPYNALVREYFRQPRHAGPLPPGGARRAEASLAQPGARLHLAAVVDGGTVLAMRFGAYGCPHLIAAAEWLCRRCEGAGPEVLDGLPRNELISALSVPVEKTGRILLLEDTLGQLQEKLTG